MSLGGHQHVRVDQHRQHAQGLVVLDEAHAAHVGGEVVDVADVLADLDADIKFLKVADDVFRTVGTEVPIV